MSTMPTIRSAIWAASLMSRGLGWPGFQLGGDLLVLVDVQFPDHRATVVLVGDFFDDRRDRSARAAPHRPKTLSALMITSWKLPSVTSSVLPASSETSDCGARTRRAGTWYYRVAATVRRSSRGGQQFSAYQNSEFGIRNSKPSPVQTAANWPWSRRQAGRTPLVNGGGRTPPTAPIHPRSTIPFKLMHDIVTITGAGSGSIPNRRRAFGDATAGFLPKRQGSRAPLASHAAEPFRRRVRIPNSEFRHLNRYVSRSSRGWSTAALAVGNGESPVLRVDLAMQSTGRRGWRGGKPVAVSDRHHRLSVFSRRVMAAEDPRGIEGGVHPGEGRQEISMTRDLGLLYSG